MENTAEQIAGHLEQSFANRGFKDPGVAELRVAAHVSLRTLYKYFPSRDAMVVGALNHRHGRYLSFLAKGEPAEGPGSILHLFDRLELWMHENAPSGCLFVNALAAHPENAAIKSAVQNHKKEITALLGLRSGRPDFSTALFLLHEGATAAWPFIGETAFKTARKSVLKFLEEN